MLSRDIVWLDPEQLTADMAERQRQQELDVGDLIPSIREKGVLLPLLVEEDSLKLIAGWRRWTAAKFLKLTEVPCRLVAPNTSELQLQLIEWEENAKRKDLTWQDNARAQWRMHELQLALNPEWTPEQSAIVLKQSERHTEKMLEVGEALAAADAGIMQADTLTQAWTILTRRRERAKGEALNKIMELDLPEEEEDEDDRGEDPHGLPAELGGRDEDAANAQLAGTQDAGVLGDGVLSRGETSLRRDSLPSSARRGAPPYAIIHGDAHEWLAGYSGPKFNFLHCDLPYGVKLNGQAGQAGFEGGGYDSDPDIYWALCRSIREHWDKFMYPSSHVMFWISMKFYSETVEFFEQMGLKVNPSPLIWHKTDNKGIIADHLRGPRNIYEAALIMSTGDRHIARPVSNVYGCPTAKGNDAIHTNEKPEPMLKHFFQMFVDEHSRVLDPTCGSGSSIRVAEAAGAEAALGLEFNPEFAERAQRKLVSARGLAQLSGIVSHAVASSALDIPADGE